jgi:AcrR family transcriptional regulator
MREVKRSRREALIFAAAGLMRKKGYTRTTIRDIARAVGMGSGSPFCHFRSKTAILAAIAESGLRRAVGRAERIATTHADPRRRLLALMRLHLDFLHGADSDLGAVTLHEWRWLPEEEKERLRGLRRRYEAIWRDTLAGLLAERAVASDPMLCARLLLGSLNWTLHWWRADGTDRLARLRHAWVEVLAPRG